MSNPEEISLTKLDAEQTATSLNLILNNAVFFGAAHPSTIKAAANFAEKMNALPVDEVTLLKNGNSIYLEKWVVDNRLNLQRTNAQFLKTGVESITVRRGVTAEDLQEFILVYMEAVTTTASLSTITDHLREKNISKVLVNYITFQKVTRDEKIVDAELIMVDASDMPSSNFNIPQSNARSSGFDDLFVKIDNSNRKEFDSRPIVPTFRSEHHEAFELTSLFGDLIGKKDTSEHSALMSVEDILAGEQQVIERFRDKSTESATGTWGLPNLKEQFKAVGIEIEQGKLQSGDKIDYDRLFDSLTALTGSLKQNESIASRFKTIEERETVYSEVEQLTFTTMVQVVRREFEKGKPSVKKMANMLKRMTPSASELRKLLPRLKNQIIEDGYTVSDFLELTVELERELSTDNALEGLFREASDFGVERDELISAIMENPGESSRLLLLAAEVQKRLGKGNTVSTYVEKIIEDMTSAAVIDQVRNNGDDENIHTALLNIVTSFENTVLQKLRSSSEDQSFVEDLATRLKEKFPETVERIKSEWLVNRIGNTTDHSSDGLLQAIVQVSRDSSEVEHFKQKAENLGAKFGYSESEVEQILLRAKQQEEVREKRSELHVLSARSTIHFTKRYLAEFTRYGHPFSVVLLSSHSNFDEDIQFLDQVSLFINDTFRTLDLVGQVTIKGKTTPLIILPMTDSKGLTALRERFRAIPGAGEYIITAVAVDMVHRTTSFERIMKMLLKKHVLKNRDSGKDEK